MNNKRKLVASFFSLSLLIVLTTCTSCKTDECHEEYFDYSFNVKILLQDKNTGESLIGPFGKKYDTDLGIFLTDSQTNEVPLVLLNEIVSFNVELENTTEPNEVVDFVYLLDLPPCEDFPRRDIDTLKFQITIVETSEECYSFKFGTMRYYFNNILSFEGDHESLSNGDVLVSIK